MVPSYKTLSLLVSKLEIGTRFIPHSVNTNVIVDANIHWCDTSRNAVIEAVNLKRVKRENVTNYMS